MDDFLELQSTFLGELLMEFHEAKKKNKLGNND
jgi:hypothetical protein